MLVNGAHFSDAARKHDGSSFHYISSVSQYYHTKGMVIYRAFIQGGWQKWALAEVEVILYFQDKVGMRIILGSGMVIHVKRFSGL